MIILPNRAPLAKPAGFTRVNPAHPLAKNVIFAHYMYPKQLPGAAGWGVLDSGPNALHATTASRATVDIIRGQSGGYEYVQPSAVSLRMVDTPRLTPASKSVTIFARVKSTSAGSTRQWVIMKGTSTALSYWLCPHDYTGSGPGCGFYNSSTYYVSGANTDIGGDNKWHNIAGTIRQTGTTSECAYYVDGRLDKITSGLASTMPTNTEDTDIGWYVGDGSNFAGSIEHVVLLNVALGPAWIAALNANPYALLASNRRLFANMTQGVPHARRGNICVIN